MLRMEYGYRELFVCSWWEWFVYVGGSGHVAHIDGCASWFYSMRLMLGFFKLRSESAICVTAGSE